MENISVFDLVVTVLLATATFWGGLLGVVSQISSIATWVLSGLAAARYGSVVGEVVSIPEPWRAPVSALIVFCAALLALNAATRFVKRAVSLAGLKEFDRQTGALFGFFKGCAICVVLTFFCVLASEKTRDLVDKSKTGPYLASVSLLLKGAFPESETMTRFETLVASMESTQAKGNKLPSLNSEIADLETYLKNNVLSQEAAEVVEEAESGATSDGAASSGWSRFIGDLRGWADSRRASEPTANVANDFDGSRYVENVGERYVDDAPAGEGEREGWGSWNVWGGRGNETVRGGETNDGYYNEYEDKTRDWQDVDYDGEPYYNDGARNDGAETSRGWSDLTTFLTNLTGDSYWTREADETNGASSERRTANYAAPSNESLNDFLGVPANANSQSATPTFDASAPRTTDGAILGRPNTSPTLLIPPLPY
ncbi:MAG: CvpA family protein [Thermoguttaceae bacterium]|nr:CvpA family protein [Thermoguttaceae bacterium]